jgi:catechol 2,3-dioxygenase-like lactoylglutathione lyase family enzyme
MHESKMKFDVIDHVAIAVTDVASSVNWYKEQFKCNVTYQDETWAFIEFENIKLALVVPNQHPPHVAFVTADAERHGKLKKHRDGTRSVYIKDPAGNSVEIMADDSEKASS